MNETVKYFGIVALIIPLAAYIYAAMSAPKSRTSTLAGFFTAYKEVGAPPYSNSSIAYAFQVATLFPFLYWGATGQLLPALVNALFWGIGIFSFRAAIIPIIRSLRDSNDVNTLHGLLGTTFNSILVRKVSALITILGMTGVALAEAYWGMQILKVIVPADTPAYYALILGSLLFVLAYIWYGGAWGSMKTDMLQLAFSYIGFTLAFLYVIFAVLSGPSFANDLVGPISIAMVIGGGLSIWTRIRKGLHPVAMMDDDKESLIWSFLRKVFSYATLAAMVLLTSAFAILLVRTFESISTHALANTGEVGWIGVAALSLMAIMFQFIDMTAWQRIQAIEGNDAQMRDDAKRGLVLYGIESPYSWILCLAMGVLLAQAFPQIVTDSDAAGPLAVFPRVLFETGSTFSYLVAFAFMVAVIGVMLSTIDSAILGAMYAWVADIQGAKFSDPNVAAIKESPADQAERPSEPPPLAQEGHEEGRSSQELTNGDAAALLTGKKAAFWVVISIFVIVISLGWILKKPSEFISVLVGFYGSMLSLFPAVMFMLFAPPSWVKPSGATMASGIVAGVLGAMYFTTRGLFYPELSWYGVFAGPGISVAVSGLFYAYSILVIKE